MWMHMQKNNTFSTIWTAILWFARHWAVLFNIVKATSVAIMYTVHCTVLRFSKAKKKFIQTPSNSIESLFLMRFDNFPRILVS